MTHTEVSKFLSYVLRHQPSAIGLTLDAEGWAKIDALITGATQNGKNFDLATLYAVVSANDKKRFTISEDGLRIRAAQGHSVSDVTISYAE